MTVLARYRKQPREIQKHRIDYKARYGAECANISSVRVLVEPYEQDRDLEATHILDPSGQYVDLYVSNGRDSYDYTVTLLASWKPDYLVTEDEVMFLVNEIP